MENTMNLSPYFKSIVDQDRCAVAICNLKHEIIYNGSRGGAALVGQSLLDCHNAQSNEMIKKVVAWFGESTDHYIMSLSLDMNGHSLFWAQTVCVMI